MNGRRRRPSRSVVIQAQHDPLHARVVLQVLLQRRGESDGAVLPRLIDAREGQRIGGAPILPPQLQQRQVRKGVNGSFKYTEGFATGAEGNGKGKPLITAGDFTGKAGIRKSSAQRTIGRGSMFITHEYAVMTLGILVKLPMLDAVIDDLRVNAPAPQICKNTPVVGVFGWEGKFSFRERCGWL